jgi:hypothetical protein
MRGPGTQAAWRRSWPGPVFGNVPGARRGSRDIAQVARGHRGMILAVPRIAATSLVLLVTATLAAGCGGRAHSASTPITKAQAVAFAHAVNLRAADLPARQWLVGDPETLWTRSKQGGELSGCGSTRATSSRVMRINSPVFSLKPGGQAAYPHSARVQSVVYVMANTQLARQELASARNCVARQLARGTLETIAFGPEHFAPLHATLPGVPVAELRSWVTLPELTATGLSVRSYEDRFVFVVGRVEVALRTTESPHPFPTATENHLLTMLHSRAEAQEL